MQILLSISALLVTIMLMQVGTTALGPLDVLSAVTLQFSNIQIGLMGASHFVGFLLGCLISPALIRRVGHARSYGVVVAASIVAVLLHPVIPHFMAWCVLRVVNGIAVASAYTAIESWLNAKLDRSNRAKFFSVYRVVDMTGGILAQSLIIFLEPAIYLSYSILAIFLTMSLLPLGLTRSVQPELPENQIFSPAFAFTVSPLAVMGVLIVGATGSAIRMIGPLFAYELNFNTSEIGIFLVLFMLGGMIIQFPIGYLANKITTRQMLGFLSAITIIVSLGFSYVQVDTIFVIKTPLILVFIFGATTMPLYSICAIHANNLISQSQMAALSASLIFTFALGAIISPVIASYLIDHFGPDSLFIYFAVLHAILMGYTGYRSVKRPDIANISKYFYIPRTSLFIARTIKNLKNSSTRKRDMSSNMQQND